MVVAPGPQTSLSGTTLMVDDTYNGIEYSNGWQTNQNSTYAQSSIWGGSSFMNTSHETNTVGESLTFSYTGMWSSYERSRLMSLGTNLSIYGNFLWEQVGGMTLSYNINGGTNFSQTFTSDGTNPIKEEPNFKLVDTGPLSPGNYTLTLTLTDCVGQTLLVDYILYTPSFSNLASMPNLTASTTQSQTTTVGQTSTAPTGGGTSSPQPSSKTNAGAIAGGTVGGIVFLLILGALAFWWFRRRKTSNVVPEMSAPARPPRPFLFIC